MFREIVGVMGMQLQKEIGLDLFYVVGMYLCILRWIARPDHSVKKEGDVKLFETSRQPNIGLNKKSYSFLHSHDQKPFDHILTQYSMDNISWNRSTGFI